jgi:aminoglycoside phosphotransferase (APT) family kinase protein
MSQDIEVRLQAALHKHCGADHELRQCRRLSAGASAETYAVDVQTAQGEQALILRRSAGGKGLGVNVDKRTEALVQRAAAAHGVPAPAVLCILDQEDELGEGYVMHRGEGETLARRILENPELATARERLTAQCAQALAAIHAVRPNQLPKLPALSAAPQLKQIEALYRNGPLVSPVFELALRWLGKRMPAADETLHLVHGDFRNGNLLIDTQGLQLVLDWELTHLGDPMEDLGWLCVNAWRFGQRDRPVGGFGQRDALYAAYEAASGRRVDPGRVRFWEVFGTPKWGVICILQAMFHLSGAVRSVERAAIGRRVSETELDLLDLIEGRD